MQGSKTRTYTHTPGERRRGARHRAEQESGFQETYSKRAGSEGSIGRIKRRVGLHQLRARGRPSVFCAVYLKLGGWNILQAARARRLRAAAARRTQRAARGSAQTAHAALAGLC